MRLVDADMLKKNIPTEEINARIALATAPTVDSEPVKHGRWISINGWVECSVCHREPPNETNIESDYCPNCGARMDGGEE